MKKKPKLEMFLKEKNWSVYKLSFATHLTQQTILNLINGRDCRLSTAYKIEQATEGKVTCQDLFKDYVEPHLSDNS